MKTTSSYLRHTRHLYLALAALFSCNAGGSRNLVASAVATPVPPATPEDYTPNPSTVPDSILEVTPHFRCTGTSYPAGKVRLYWHYSTSGTFEDVDAAAFQDIATSYSATTHCFLPPRHLLVGGHDDEGMSVFELWELKAPLTKVNSTTLELSLVPQGVASIRSILRSSTPWSTTPGNIFWNRGKPNAAFVTFVGRGGNIDQDLDIFELTWPPSLGQGALSLVLSSHDEIRLEENFDMLSSGDHVQFGYVYILFWNDTHMSPPREALVFCDSDRDGTIDSRASFFTSTLCDMGLTDATQYLEYGGATPVFPGMN